jgi:glycosyltransferase involved in cell wall biosynthesis
LIRSLRDEVKHGRVILGAETEPMREALMRMTGVPFTYFPHPVAPGGEQGAGSKERHISSTITMASYGSARYEKGSDLLVAAVDEFCRRYPDSRVRFVLQSVDGDANFWEHLKGNPKVRLIPDYFADGEYAQRLQETDVLLLPYRRSSYALRVSRVVIEAMVHGIPVVATRGTTLAEQAEEFGAAVLCEDENAESLVAAMHDLEQRFDELKQCVELQKQKAREHFSIVFFRELLMKTQS